MRSMRVMLAVMRVMLAVMRVMLVGARLTLAVMRLCGITSGGEPSRRWRGGERAVVCDLRTRLVQRVRDAAHSPDVRAKVVGLFMYAYLEDT